VGNKVVGQYAVAQLDGAARHINLEALKVGPG
jgi:hypothetical protein